MPDWNGDLRQRLATLRLSPTREAEIIEELAQHLDQRYEELRAAGRTDAEARRAATLELHDPETLARHMRHLRQVRVPTPITPGVPSRGSWARELWQDLRYAARALRRQPGFAGVAVLTLALGIGANSAIFALVDATLLRPLPFGDPDRIVMLYERSTTSARGAVSPLNMTDWNSRNRTFDVIAGYVNGLGGMVMTGADGLAENVSRQWVTAGFFDALGVRPIAGRTFLPDDDSRRANAVVLSEAFWRSRFNADPAIVGRDVRLDGEPFTVVGVVPRDFQLLAGTNIWAVRPILGAPPAVRTLYQLRAIGRMKPGVTIEAARADLGAVADGLADEFPATNKGRGITIEPLHDALIGRELRSTALLFVGVVGFVLLICCANVANLLLARAAGRRRELALRSAIGAARGRLVRQLLTESVFLSLLGGALGLVVGAAILQAAPSLIPAQLLPAPVTLVFDVRVVAFCAATALLVGVLFGLAPAWQATGLSLARAMGSESRTVTGRGGRIRSLLVVGEVATAVLLLVGAGLLLRTLLALDNVDRGYRAESVLTMVVDPLASQFCADAACFERFPTRPPLLQFFEDVEREVMAVPGVRSVGWASTLPYGESMFGRLFFEVVGDAAPDQSRLPSADLQIVSPGYFRTLDLPLVAGRNFDNRDTGDRTPVCIVNEAFVRAHLSGRSPMGVRIATRTSQAPNAPTVVREIVGVAKQVKGRPDETEDMLQVYVPIAQNPVDDIFMLVAPATGRGDALTAPVRAAIGRVDKEQLVGARAVRTLEDVAFDATSRHRFRAVLVGTFAGLALLLAMVGVFGLLAYSVQQRIRDFGVHRALGATSGDVLRLVAGSAARLVAAGAALGLVSAAIASRLLTTMLFGVEPLDWMTFGLVTVALVVTAVLAVAGPAWRASRIDPAVALRAD
jgi:putative ABC transport system permease protein